MVFVFVSTPVVFDAGFSSATAPRSLSIKVDGTHFVNQNSATIRLLGVGGPGTEYACVQGWGETSTPLTQLTVDRLVQWHVNVMRISLNEDCWLGLNHQPSFGTVTTYRTAIENFVRLLNYDSIYVIVDLHWSAPGTNVATDQMSMPDAHSIVFWKSVAKVFKTNHAVLFDLFNEPFSPSYIWSGAPVVSWWCWRHGGCPAPVINQSGSWTPTTATFITVGMQQLLSAVRSVGATQPVLVGGLNYANDLSGFLTHQLTDLVRPAQIAASFHNYSGEACQHVACWNSTVAPIARKVPIVTGEFGSGKYCVSPPALGETESSFDSTYMSWSDAHGISYVQWGWVLNGTPPACESGENKFANYGLYDNAGTPVAPDGQLLHDHLASLYSHNALL